MSKIALPKNIKYAPHKDENRGEIIVEPCFPGYGMTIGNSIRRVLLSSLPGAAVTGVKIKEVDHEFMVLPHLKEDILEFILKLKQLNLKVHSEEPLVLELKVHGKKEIKASDITPNAQVEIINKDLVLGHITDMAGSLNAEIHVSQGMGYEIIETREHKEKEIGYIDMDSIFSPVLSAGIKIENVRVGKMTNWDRLVIDISTDGTITPEEAFNQSVAILIEQFKALSPEVLAKKEKEEKSAEEDNDKEEENKPEDGNEEEEVIKKDAVEPEKKKRGRPKKS